MINLKFIFLQEKNKLSIQQKYTPDKYKNRFSDGTIKHISEIGEEITYFEDGTI